MKNKEEVIKQDSIYVRNSNTGCTNTEKNMRCGMLRKNVCLSLIFYIGGILFPVYSIEPLSNDSISLELSDSIAKEIDLTEITIKGETPLVESKADRTIVHVKGSYLANTVDGDEMLRLTPGLIVSKGSIVVPGEGTPVYYINGRRVHNEKEITMLSPNNVTKIEIVTNPPAMYDADGNSVILITVKNEHDDAVKVGAAYKQNTFANASAFIDGTLRKGVFTFNGRYSFYYNKNRILEDNIFETSDIDTLFTKKHSVDKGRRHNFITVFDWNWKDRHKINLDVNGYYTLGGSTSTRDAIFTSVKEKNFTTHFSIPDNSLGLNSTLSYNFSIDTLGQNLHILGDLSLKRASISRNYYNTELYGDTDNPAWTYNSNKSYPFFVSAQVDYCKPIKKIWNIECGVKYYYTGTNTFTNVTGDYEINQKYGTVEQNLAEYVTVKVNPTSKLSISSGIRCETMWRMIEKDGTLGYDSVSTDVFPSVLVNYNFSEKYSLGFSYTKRIDRPSFYMMDPSLRIDPLLNRCGNPYLANTKIHKLKISSKLFRDFRISVGASYLIDYISFYIFRDPNDSKVTDIRYFNNGNHWQYSCHLGYDKQFFSIWDFSAYAGFWTNWFRYDDNGVAKNNNIPGFYVGVSNQLSLPLQFKLTLNVDYTSEGSVDAVVCKPSWSSYISLEKSFLKETLIVSLSLNNIFSEQEAIEKSVLSGHNINISKNDNRYGKISIVYKFGRSYNYWSKSESQEEKNRM